VLDHLAARPDVTGKVGTTGYCMGGNISLRIATLFGDRIAATASFHGGGLVTAAPDSPHLRAAAIRSRVYVAAASEDETFNDEARRTLEAALTEAGVEHTIEVYPGRHGFAVTDNPTHDAACAARHFAALESFYAATLRA
jgi:carboxymethylenebutenolidase